MPLAPKTRVLITAGANGIGKAMAEAFSAANADVWITDVDENALEQAPSHWRRTMADASDEPAVEALFGQIDEQWGGIDVVCANAGIAGPTGFVEELRLDDWRRCVAVNLEGAFLAAKYASPRLKAAQSGALVFTSSNAGFQGFPTRAPYSAAKWGVIGLMKTVAMELGPHGIRANAICPGPVEGPRIDGVIEREAAAKGSTPAALRKAYADAYSMRSFVTAEDVANMAVFLASPEARMVSGQVIAVDGHTENADPRA